jgi:HEAT repeat protein
VQAYLLQELQTAGGKEVAEPLGKLLTDDELSDWAARALVSIGDGAVEQFRAALLQAKGKSRLTVIQNLGVLCDAKSADAMRAALKDTDREIRIVAARGLAKIGDASAADLLLKAADGPQGWERIQMTKFCLVLAENLTAAGRKSDAAKIYTQLRDTRKDPSEKYVCEAAARGLAAAK